MPHEQNQSKQWCVNVCSRRIFIVCIRWSSERGVPLYACSLAGFTKTYRLSFDKQSEIVFWNITTNNHHEKIQSSWRNCSPIKCSIDSVSWCLHINSGSLVAGWAKFACWGINLFDTWHTRVVKQRCCPNWYPARERIKASCPDTRPKYYRLPIWLHRNGEFRRTRSVAVG